MTAVARTSRTSRLIGLAGACALVVVSLSGCIKLDADLAINADATASGTLAIEFQKEAAGFLGITDLASFEEGFAGEELGTEGLDQFSDCATSETDAAYVYTCTFENQTFEGTGGPWSITKEGDLVVLRVVNEAQSGDDAALLGDASLGSITVAATFPGPITAVTGEGVEKTSDTSATITASLTDSVDASVTAETSGGGFSISSLLVLLLALAVLALIVVVVVVLLMRRRKGAVDEAGAPVDPAAPVTAAAGGVVAADDSTGTTDVIDVVETTEIVEPVTDAAPTEIVEPVTDAAPTEIVETVETVETVENVETDPQSPSA